MSDTTEYAVEEFLGDYARRSPGTSGFQRRLDPASNAVREFSLEFNEGGLLHRLAVVPEMIEGRAVIRARYFIGPPNRVVHEDDTWRSTLNR